MREAGDGDQRVDRDVDEQFDARLLADRWVSAPEQGEGLRHAGAQAGALPGGQQDQTDPTGLGTVGS